MISKILEHKPKYFVYIFRWLCYGIIWIILYIYSIFFYTKKNNFFQHLECWKKILKGPSLKVPLPYSFKIFVNLLQFSGKITSIKLLFCLFSVHCHFFFFGFQKPQEIPLIIISILLWWPYIHIFQVFWYLTSLSLLLY